MCCICSKFVGEITNTCMSSNKLQQPLFGVLLQFLKQLKGVRLEYVDLASKFNIVEKYYELLVQYDKGIYVFWKQA